MALLGLALNPYFCLSLSLLFYKSPKLAPVPLEGGAGAHGVEYPSFPTPAGADSRLTGALSGGPVFLIRSA